MSNGSKERTKMTAGLDLGDRYSHICLLDTESGELVEESRLRTTPEAFGRRFGSDARLTLALEVGTHSPWVSRLLSDCGHEVLVANPRRTRLIYGEGRKSDRLDAEKLARLARADPELLYPIEHRGEASQAHLALIHSREALIRGRTQLINHVRGTVKSFGTRLPGCSARSFHKKVSGKMPSELAEGLEPIVETIASLTERIRDYDRRIEVLATEQYPETELLRQVQGVGTLSSLTFVLTLEDPQRFSRIRAVGAYLGLVPGKDQSGEKDTQKGISRDLRGRRQDAQGHVGEQRPLHPGPFLPGLGPQAPRPEDRRTRRQECQEAGRSGGGQETLRTTSPSVDFWPSLRTITQCAVVSRSRRGGCLKEVELKGL